MQRESTVLCFVALAVLCRVAAGAEEQPTREIAGSEPATQAAPAEPDGAPAAKAAKPKGKRRTELEEVVVEAKKPLSSASSDVIRAQDYSVRPHDTLMEIINNTPGLVAAQHQGGGKAPQWLIRGFDADHGTDFAVFVDDLPVNLVSNAHGQGYADVNFVIPEIIERLQLYKGPYFTQFGDFANAGALNMVTKDEFKQNFAFAEGASFDTQRYVLGGSPQLSWAKTVLAAQAYFTNGPFVNPQHYSRYNVFAKLTADATPDSKLSVSGTVYEGDWDGSGQIPLRAVQAGFISLDPVALDPTAPTRPFGRFDAIDRTEGGTTDRENLDVHYKYTPTAAEEWSFQVYGTRYKLQLFSDFTFFKDTGLRFTRTGNTIQDVSNLPFNPDFNYVPGDAIEQNDQRLMYGGRAWYTRYWVVPNVPYVGDLPIRSRVGVENRNDDVSLNLYRQTQRQRFFPINQLTADESSVSGFVEHQLFTDWARLEVGLRGDMFFFQARNQLPSNVGVFDPTTQTCVNQSDPNFCAVKITGNSNNGIVSPKANLVLTPVPNTDVYLNFGNGFHSNDIRNVLLSKANPQLAGGLQSALTQSLGYELGSRTRQFDRLDAAAALWLIDLDSELVFSGDGGNQESGAGGTFEPAGPTRRWGIDFETRYQFTDWLFFDYDLSYADPRFRDTGAAIPLAPTLLMNGGLTARFTNGFEAGLRVRYLANRPANEERTLTAQGYTLVDLLGRYRWRNVEASLSFLNLTNADWRDAQFSDESCLIGELQNGAVACSTQPGQQGMHPAQPAQDMHFTPGNPFAVRGGLAVYF